MFLACYIDWGNEKRENIFTYGGWFTSWIFTHWKQIGLIDSHSFAVHLIYLLIKPNWYSTVWSFNGIKTDKILTFDAKYFAQADSQFLTVSWCCFYLHAIFSQQSKTTFMSVCSLFPASGHPHCFFCHLELGSDREVPSSFVRHVDVEFDMPTTSASKATVRSISVEDKTGVRKWVNYSAHYSYKVKISICQSPWLLCILHCLEKSRQTNGNLVHVKLCAVAPHVQPADSGQTSCGLWLSENGLILLTVALWKSMYTTSSWEEADKLGVWTGTFATVGVLQQTEGSHCFCAYCFFLPALRRWTDGKIHNMYTCQESQYARLAW